MGDFERVGLAAVSAASFEGVINWNVIGVSLSMFFNNIPAGIYLLQETLEQDEKYVQSHQ